MTQSVEHMIKTRIRKGINHDCYAVVEEGLGLDSKRTGNDLQNFYGDWTTHIEPST